MACRIAGETPNATKEAKIGLWTTGDEGSRNALARALQSRDARALLPFYSRLLHDDRPATYLDGLASSIECRRRRLRRQCRKSSTSTSIAPVDGDDDKNVDRMRRQ